MKPNNFADRKPKTIESQFHEIEDDYINEKSVPISHDRYGWTAINKTESNGSEYKQHFFLRRIWNMQAKWSAAYVDVSAGDKSVPK